MRSIAAVLALVFGPTCVWGQLADGVRVLVEQNDLATAERAVRAVRAKGGATPEVAAAISWLGRGALAARQLDRAEAYATEARNLALPMLGVRRIDADPWLATAVGASIEVHAGVLAARGEIPEALAYLRQQLKMWTGTSLTERISKNINLLNLEGKPAPALEGVSLSALRGRPVLLFFWAHWCPDCKAEAPILAAIRSRFEAQGLAVVGPTRLYGYAAGGEPAAPAAEKQYIEQIRQRFYAPLEGMPTPISAANFQAYGASTTPTLVLVDRSGLVRDYHPGAMSGAELVAKVQGVLR